MHLSNLNKEVELPCCTFMKYQTIFTLVEPFDRRSGAQNQILNSIRYSQKASLSFVCLNFIKAEQNFLCHFPCPPFSPNAKQETFDRHKKVNLYTR